MVTFEARKRLAILYILIGATGGLPVFISHQDYAFALLALLGVGLLLWIFWKDKWIRERLLVTIPTSVAVGVITLYLYSNGGQWLGWVATIIQLFFLLFSVAIGWEIYSYLQKKAEP
jgi:hypothetical protein